MLDYMTCTRSKVDNDGVSLLDVLYDATESSIHQSAVQSFYRVYLKGPPYKQALH